MTRLVGVGVGGSSKVIFDILKEYSTEYEIAGWFDDDSSKIGSHHLNGRILDVIDNIHLYTDVFDAAFICVGATKNTRNRNIIFNKLKSKNISIHTIISKKALISSDVEIHEGCIILNGVMINSSVVLKPNAFLNTGCIVEHDCTVGTSSFISPGAVLCGNVKLYDNVFVGANAVIIGNTSVGSGSVIGAGSVILSDVKPNSTMVGNPGKLIRNDNI